MTAAWLIRGDARQLPLADKSVQCVVTSPPYWRQRRYGAGAGEIGQELTPALWVDALADVFAGARNVLSDTGSLWLNCGDKYAAGGLGGGGMASRRVNWRGTMGQVGWRKAPEGFKQKDLTLTPFMLADRLRRDSWYLRQTIVWSKLTAVEPPRLDRPSTSHEYLFLFTKSQDSTVRDPGESWWHSTVWCIGNDQDGQHVAQMPRELARRCIVASTREGDIVLDPFAGSFTAPFVAAQLGRRGVGVDLSGEFVQQARYGRLAQEFLPLGAIV